MSEARCGSCEHATKVIIEDNCLVAFICRKMLLIDTDCPLYSHGIPQPQFEVPKIDLNEIRSGCSNQDGNEYKTE